jgi:hypothetical protein
MTRPDPKSFDTLEKAQAEIARCYSVMESDSALFKLAHAKLDELRQETARLRAVFDKIDTWSV